MSLTAVDGSDFAGIFMPFLYDRELSQLLSIDLSIFPLISESNWAVGLVREGKNLG